MYSCQKILEYFQIGRKMISFGNASIQRRPRSQYGYAGLNERPIVEAESYTASINILMAIISDYPVAFQLRRSSIDVYAFSNFMLAFFYKLSIHQPNFRNEYFIFCDNFSAHKTQLALSIMRCIGVPFVFNAPYTVS